MGGILKDLSHLLHDSQVDRLYWRLQHKDRYFAVGKEVPLWKEVMYTKRGQADILTLDIDNRRAIYWEVKVGRPDKAYKTSKKQARSFFTHMRKHPVYNTWDHLFIYYNPIHKEMKRICH